MKTLEKCEVRIQTLNMMLGRPLNGPLSLELHQAGSEFDLVEIYENGRQRPWNQAPLAIKQMDAFIDGVISGFALRTEHICQDMLAKELAKIPGVEVGPLYSDKNRDLLREATSKDVVNSAEDSTSVDSTTVCTMTDSMEMDTPTVSECEHDLVFQYPGVFRNDIYRCTKCNEEVSKRWSNR